MALHLTIEEAQALKKALDAWEIERVVGIYRKLNSTPPGVVHGYLTGIFRQAARDERLLGTWSPDLSQWLVQAMRKRVHGEGEVRPNTFLGRRTVLVNLYQALEQHGLMVSPMHEIARVPAQRDTRALPSATELERLPVHMSLEGRAQFYLLYHHALRPGELLGLYWEDMDWEQGTLIRLTAEIELTPETLRALRDYAALKGGELFSSGKMFDICPIALRQQFWKAFQQASVTYVAPQRLRLAGLRDFHTRLNFLEAGFMNHTTYLLNLKLVDELQ